MPKQVQYEWLPIYKDNRVTSPSSPSGTLSWRENSKNRVPLGDGDVTSLYCLRRTIDARFETIEGWPKQKKTMHITQYFDSCHCDHTSFQNGDRSKRRCLESKLNRIGYRSSPDFFFNSNTYNTCTEPSQMIVGHNRIFRIRIRTIRIIKI